VKSGDTLIKIAADHHTTVKALRSANNLKTDSIKVGQPLKLPAKSAAAPADATPAPGTTAPPHSK
jgi:peptidoglycan endopeptidase LytE